MVGRHVVHEHGACPEPEPEPEPEPRSLPQATDERHRRAREGKAAAAARTLCVSLREAAEAAISVVAEELPPIVDAQMQSPGLVVVVLVRAEGLLPMETPAAARAAAEAKATPYVKMALLGGKHRSLKRQATLAPEWDQTFGFEFEVGSGHVRTSAPHHSRTHKRTH